MLLGFIAATVVLLISIWTIEKDVGNRFVSGGIFIAIFIPFEVFNISFTEYPLSKISPFSLYCTSVFFLYIFRTLFLGKKILFDRYMLCGFLYLIFVASTTYYNLGEKGFGTIIDNYLSPFMALTILVNERHKLKGKLNKRYMIVISTAAIYGVLEFILKTNILYGFIFSQMGWIDTQWNSAFHRSTSTIGHPLIAASVYIMALAFLEKNQKNYWLYFTLITMGTLSTGSRAGIAIVALIVLAKHVRLQQSKRSIIALSLIFTLSILGYLAGIFDQLIGRFANGEGSNTVRLQLLDYLPEIFKISMWGYGVGSSGDIALNIGFYNVIEVAWVALLIELGIWGLIASFITAYIIIKKYKLHNGNIVFLSSLFIMITSYNSISVHTPLIFLTVLILFIPKITHSERSNEESLRNNIYPAKV